MPFNFFDALDIFSDLLNIGSSDSSRLKLGKRRKVNEAKYKTEFWSGGILLVSSILCFIVFKDPLPEENNIQTLVVCILIGLVVAFIIFFALYHLGLYYFAGVFKFLLFSFSVILLVISAVLYIYFRSGVFI